jgi:UDP-3-O-[3-hydroxymyristoyl] glucosamine N-acyltransferase
VITPSRTPVLTLGEIGALVGGKLSGDPALTIHGVSALSDASPDQIALLAAPRYRAQVTASRAGALLVSAGLENGLDDARPRVIVADAHAALIVLLARFEPPAPPRPGVHPTAVLAKGASLGTDVELGPYAVVGEGSALGDRVRIGAHVVIGAGCRVGPDSVLHPHVTLYDGVSVGARVILHSGARIGSDGFGYAFTAAGHTKVPQVGGCVIEDDVEIGANSTVDRGSIGDTVIGRGSKLDNLVHVAHNVRLGPHCILTAQVGIAGSSTLGAGVQMGGQSGMAGHLAIGDGARIGGAASVFQDVAAGEVVLGTPAADARIMRRAWALIPRLPELFRRLRALEAKAPPGPAAGPEAPSDG